MLLILLYLLPTKLCNVHNLPKVEGLISFAVHQHTLPVGFEALGMHAKYIPAAAEEPSAHKLLGSCNDVMVKLRRTIHPESVDSGTFQALDLGQGMVLSSEGVTISSDIPKQKGLLLAVDRVFWLWSRFQHTAVMSQPGLMGQLSVALHGLVHRYFTSHSSDDWIVPVQMEFMM